MAQNPPCGARNDNGYEQGEGEAEGTVLHAVDEVHTEERGDQGGEHHDDTHGGERTHHGVHVVGDDTGVSVHRRFEDVGIDAGGLARLAHLDVSKGGLTNFRGTALCPYYNIKSGKYTFETGVPEKRKRLFLEKNYYTVFRAEDLSTNPLMVQNPGYGN